MIRIRRISFDPMRGVSGVFVFPTVSESLSGFFFFIPTRQGGTFAREIHDMYHLDPPVIALSPWNEDCTIYLRCVFYCSGSHAQPSEHNRYKQPILRESGSW